MDSREREKLNKLAYRVRDILKIETPLNFEKFKNIFETIGGSFEKASCLERYKEVVLIKKKDTFKVLYVEDTNDRSLNFALAKILGHLFYHLKYLIDEEHWNNFPDGEYY